MRLSDFLRLVASRALARLLDPFMIPGYAQFGEDRVIDAFFSGVDDGFYVDVGCNHPIAYSNTWKLYQRGWRGIAIDANPALIAEYAKTRPADIAVAKVISCAAQPVDFYFTRSSHLTSGIGEKSDGHWKRTPDNSEVVRCETATLYDLLRAHDVDPRFDLLSIDTEGNELDVLDSLRLGEFIPSLIAVEVHGFDVGAAGSNAIHAKLSGCGYELVGYAGPTLFFAWRGTDGKDIPGL